MMSTMTAMIREVYWWKNLKKTNPRWVIVYISISRYSLYIDAKEKRNIGSQQGRLY